MLWFDCYWLVAFENKCPAEQTRGWALTFWIQETAGIWKTQPPIQPVSEAASSLSPDASQPWKAQIQSAWLKQIQIYNEWHSSTSRTVSFTVTNMWHTLWHLPKQQPQPPAHCSPVTSVLQCDLLLHLERWLLLRRTRPPPLLWLCSGISEQATVVPEDSAEDVSKEVKLTKRTLNNATSTCTLGASFTALKMHLGL